jgi:solute carrier family 25 S-adenosylmethionine transporter 26
MARQQQASATQASPRTPRRHTQDVLTTGEQMLSGAVARVCGQTALHPLEVLRTRMQIVGGGAGQLKLSTGVFVQAGLAAPAGVLQFTAAEYVRSNVARPGCGVLERMGADLLAGCCGATVATVVRVPQEVIKQGCMAGLYPHTFAAIAAIWRQHHSLRGFYVGFWSQLQRDIWWNSLSFVFFHAQKRLWERRRGRECRVYENMAFGVLGVPPPAYTYCVLAACEFCW